MSESNNKRTPIILSSLFITFPDSPLSFSNTSKSHKSLFDSKKSPRNFQRGGVGLGIVAAMNENSVAFSTAISTRTATTALSPRSVPIPIVSGSTSTKSKGSMLEKEAMELSESYTCVISHVGNKSIRKHEYFERPEPDEMVGNCWGNSWVLYASPPKCAEGAAAVPVADFLNSCYLCRKKLQGLDIFMYRGDKAFCSAECRRQQIDEPKETCGSEALKSLDYSCSPCSAPMIF